MFPNLSFPPKEWLLTNGLGGYAMGCVDEVNRRKYHGYLIGAVNSPSKRINYLNELIFSVELDGKQLRLGGLENDALEILFKNEGQVVHWTYVFEDFQIRKTIWMRYGFNETHVRLEFSGQLNKIRLYATPLFSIRDHHATVMADTKDYMVLLGEQDVWVAHEDVGATRVDFGEGNFMRRNQIVTEPIYVIESMRGECDEERCFSPGEIWMDLDAQNSTWEFVITDGNVVFSEAFDTSMNERRAMQKALLEKANAESGPKWLQQAVIGADKFVVQRGDGLTIVAGYPWFTDWGRDTMISLPGLLLANGRNEDALQILNSFKNYISEGMLPNLFPDTLFDHFTPYYNTVDATLWFFHAINALAEAGNTRDVVEKFFGALCDIFEWHLKGTRYGIVVDEEDGLLCAGDESTQLTWMDVKIEDYVVTPRSGKAVEINALWICAMRILKKFALLMQDGDVDARVSKVLKKAEGSFAKRFWNGEYLFDVIDTPEGKNDARVRPNQLFALSLVPDLLSQEMKESVLAICEEALLTPFGLRSLSSEDENYIGTYQGAQNIRDLAYHQGTVWGWLMGVFCEAHYHLYHDVEAIEKYLAGLIENLDEAGLGTLSENFWGDAPYYAAGCPAQAWSQAELLRIWRMIHPR